MDGLLAIGLACAIPGIVLVVAGAALLIGAQGRPELRIPAGRLFYAGLGLLILLPGVAILVGVMVGLLRWPALIAAIAALPMGAGILYGLRIHWDNPWSRAADSNPS